MHRLSLNVTPVKGFFLGCQKGDSPSSDGGKGKVCRDMG